MEHPIVSVLITAYNREEYIADAIGSVLISTYANYELIVLDDCSTDDTVKIAKSFESKDPRVKVYVNHTNLGQFPNRNKATEYASGEFLFFVDSDDTIFPNTISDLIREMNRFPEASFGMHAPAFMEVGLVNSKTIIADHFFKAPILYQGPGATIIRRSYFNKIGKYPINYGIPGDMFFNIKACCYSPLVVLPFVFMNYRRHEGQEINNSYDYLYNNYKYMRDALDMLPLGLPVDKINWLRKKNKRRFTINIIKYFSLTLSIKKTAFAIKAADFSLKDAFVGIFH